MQPLFNDKQTRKKRTQKKLGQQNAAMARRKRRKVGPQAAVPIPCSALYHFSKEWQEKGQMQTTSPGFTLCISRLVAGVGMGHQQPSALNLPGLRRQHQRSAVLAVGLIVLAPCASQRRASAPKQVQREGDFSEGGTEGNSQRPYFLSTLWYSFHRTRISGPFNEIVPRPKTVLRLKDSFGSLECEDRVHACKQERKRIPFVSFPLLSVAANGAASAK